MKALAWGACLARSRGGAGWQEQGKAGWWQSTSVWACLGCIQCQSCRPTVGTRSSRTLTAEFILPSGLTISSHFKLGSVKLRGCSVPLISRRLAHLLGGWGWLEPAGWRESTLPSEPRGQGTGALIQATLMCCFASLCPRFSFSTVRMQNNSYSS